MQYIYLHGFASSAQSLKAQFFKQHFAELGLELNVLDLNLGNFRLITLSKMLDYIAKVVNFQDTTLIGSSLGGWLSLLIAEYAPQVKQLVLMAPAIQMKKLWPGIIGQENLLKWQKYGSLAFYHSASKSEQLLDYEFVVDLKQINDSEFYNHIPTLIFHGKNDAIIPIEVSLDYAQNRSFINLQQLDSDHSLENCLNFMWETTRDFLHLS